MDAETAQRLQLSIGCQDPRLWLDQWYRAIFFDRAAKKKEGFKGEMELEAEWELAELMNERDLSDRYRTRNEARRGKW